MHRHAYVHIPERLLRHAVFSRIDDEGVACRPGFKSVCDSIGIDLLKRTLGIVEVEAPLEETGIVLEKELSPDHTRPSAGHGEKTVGHIDGLSAAVIDPEVGDPG